jgi:hypothetical protein
MAYGVVLYALVSHFAPELVMSEGVWTATGAAMVGVLIVFILISALRDRRGSLTGPAA